MERISNAFFRTDPVTCARGLIGSHLHWHGCIARIVETEAYAAEDDPACHTWFRPGARAFVKNHDAGDAYVYLSYGVHWLFNFLVKGDAGSGFVLLRAIEPVSGIEAMRRRRPGTPDHLLGAGPGRLTKALGIGGNFHGAKFDSSPERGLTQQFSEGAVEVVAGGRIGISRAKERLWRFGEASSPSLSRKF